MVQRSVNLFACTCSSPPNQRFFSFYDGFGKSLGPSAKVQKELECLKSEVGCDGSTRGWHCQRKRPQSPWQFEGWLHYQVESKSCFLFTFFSPTWTPHKFSVLISSWWRTATRQYEALQPTRGKPGWRMEGRGWLASLFASSVTVEHLV